MMDNNNNNNMMEINNEETQKKRERQEKIDNLKKKFKGLKDKVAEEIEDRKKAKEEKQRVKEEENKFKAAEAQSLSNQTPTPPPSNSFHEHTVTNSTISKPTKVKKTLSPQEERARKRKRKKLIRNIMTIPEIIAVVFLANFLKNKYVDYSKNVHQVLNYASGDYVYEIHRDNDIIKVGKNVQEKCEKAPCSVKRLSDYDIKFSKNQMIALRLFMDLEFGFKSKTKTITISDIKTELGKRSIYSLIHNNPVFLSTDNYGKYDVVDYEQMSSYNERGYKYVVEGEKKSIYVAMGERPTSGYALVVNSAYKKGDDLYFFILEQTPEQEETSLSLVTHPMVQIELQETPKNIYVYSLETGEEFKNLDAPQTETTEKPKEPDKGVADVIGDLKSDLKGIFK